jgi:hypothetical protein
MVTKSTRSATHRGRHVGELEMKNLILAAIAALGVAVTVAPAANAASTIAGDAKATRMQQTGSYS